MSEARGWFVGVDVGGTFTDVVLADADGDIHVDKVPDHARRPTRRA